MDQVFSNLIRMNISCKIILYFMQMCLPQVSLISRLWQLHLDDNSHNSDPLGSILPSLYLHNLSDVDISLPFVPVWKSTLTFLFFLQSILWEVLSTQPSKYIPNLTTSHLPLLPSDQPKTSANELFKLTPHWLACCHVFCANGYVPSHGTECSSWMRLYFIVNKIIFICIITHHFPL